MIMYLIGFIIFFVWFGFWSAQAGRSMRSLSEKLDSWQDKKPWYSEVPEAIIAVTIAIVGVWGLDKLFNVPALYSLGLFCLFTVISYAGKQSATWAYLRWEGHTEDKNGDGIITDADGRDSTMRNINSWVAARLGYKLGDEGYSWVWAFTKGFITTAPVFCLGAIFQPIGREIASHAKGRLPGDSNFWMESFGDGFGYANACFFFILICGFITG